MLSFFARAPSGASPEKPRPIGIQQLWPALCILPLLSGCYFGPINLIEADMPPEILSSNKAPWDSTLVIEQATNVYVFVQDEDQESLRFEWVLSNDGRVENAKTLAPGTSQIFLDADPGLDGQRLSLTVFDQEQQFDAAYWDLEVLR